MDENEETHQRSLSDIEIEVNELSSIDHTPQQPEASNRSLSNIEVEVNDFPTINETENNNPSPPPQPELATPSDTTNDEVFIYNQSDEGSNIVNQLDENTETENVNHSPENN